MPRNLDMNSRELADTLGLVDTKREPLVMGPQIDDQSDPAPSWIIPAFGLFALALVGACALFVRYVVPMIEAVL